MPTFDTTLTFFATSVLLALAPGPDNVFVLLHSAVHGRRAGLLVVLGLCSGLLFHTAAVALGLAAIFAASSTAFTVLKLCGAAYLVWLAWGAWRAPVVGVGFANSADSPAMSAGKTYGRGVLMNLTNPKVAIFFLAFLPQFADPARGSMAVQILVLGMVFILAALLTFGAIACFAASFGQAFQRSLRAQRWLNRVASVVFVGLALRLATAQR
ncbi:MAG: threonine transporter RhtB [Burkholderiales bacterium RIFCSPLOWO2_12_FULL_61_40]|nr:MAG: threonine transporter RhtB [Burkholderiales bacterium RIFCSPLOWO2_12_FULL_61_40]